MIHFRLKSIPIKGSPFQRGLNDLVDVGYSTHYRLHHNSLGVVAHINGMESFWSYAKRRLARFGDEEYVQIETKNMCIEQKNARIRKKSNSFQGIIQIYGN